MRAVRYVGHGGIEQLTVVEVPEPEVTPGHVVVRVRSTCVGSRRSMEALNGAPFKPARDLAGDVVAVGPGVQSIAAGDAVLGWSDDSAHAQLAAVPAAQLIAKPTSLAWDVAACLYVSPMAGLACVRAVEPKPGELVVVAGASGAVGFVAAQLAIRAGAAVIGLARADNGEWLKKRGIIPAVYGDGQRERIVEAAGGRRIDAFIDTVGSGYVDLAVALGVSHERINTVVDFKSAQQAGAKTMGTKQAGGELAMRELSALAASMALEIPIAAAFPLDRVQDAYRKVAAHDTRGKVVIRPQE